MEHTPSRSLESYPSQTFDQIWEITPSERDAQSEEWLRRWAEVSKSLSVGDLSTSKAPIKVVIIDLDSKSNDWKAIGPPLRLHIKATRSFPQSVQGTQQHISNTAFIYAHLISRVAPGADLLIAHITNSIDLGYQITQAISYSIEVWKADIVSMSFGFRQEDAKLREAIQRASMHGVLVFAAAGRSGGYGSQYRSFPASLREVICIHSTDGFGNISAWAPFPRRGDYNFSLPGEGIPVPGLQQGEAMRLLSGIGLETPIAAGIAATLLQYARQKQADGLLSASEVEHLHRPGGMMSMLRTMSKPRQGYDFIQPWILWEDQFSGAPTQRIKSVLAETLGLQEAVEDDFHETASVTGSSGAVQSDLSGSTAVGDGSSSIDEAIAFLLFETQKPILDLGVGRAGLDPFRRHFATLLRLHASRLSRKAETKLEKQFAALLRKRAARVSNFVTNVISLGYTQKKAMLAQLTKKEPARTKILNRYIVDTTTAFLSAQVQTSPIDAEDEIDDDDINEANAEAEDGDESAIDNVETVKSFMTSAEPFQRLSEDIYLFAFSDNRQLIRYGVDELDLFLNDSDVATIKCQISWEVLACCETDIMDQHNIAQTVTFTGNSRQAQAASCAEYLAQTWPKTGTDMMRAFHEAIAKRLCDVEFSHEHCLRLKLEPNDSKLKQPESASVEITGSRPDVIESLEQLAWLAATFRKPQGGRMTSSYVRLTRIPGPPSLELTLMSPRPVPVRAGISGNCWIPLLRQSILACGFPIAARNSGVGLEIPVPLMMYLAGVHYPIDYNDQGLVFRSHTRSDPEDFCMLVPTQKVGEVIQWHFVEAKTDQISLDDDDKRMSFMNVMAKSNSWYQTMDLDVLMNSRAYLGCWPYAKVLMGTEDFHRWAILESGLPTARPELELSPKGNINVGGNISAGIATILRVGQTCGIAFEYEVRKAQAKIPPTLVGRPQELRNASQQPVLLYDSGVQCAWIVPELSVALDMTHHFLASLNLAHGIRTKLRYAAATGDGGAAALAALDACCNEILWEEGKQKIRFGHVVNIFLSLFDQRKPAAQLPKWNPLKDVQSPRGWEYIQLRSLDPDVHKQRKTNKNHVANRSWWEITNNPTVLVLFGKGFGQVILPDLDRFSDCPSWSRVPYGRGLLTATMPCLQKLFEGGQYIQLKETNLQWHKNENSTLFERCEPGRPCIRIQELRKTPKIGRNHITGPVQEDLLNSEGAVVFGNFPKGGRNLPCLGPSASPSASPPAEARTPVLSLLIAVLVGILSAALISRLKDIIVFGPMG